MQALNKSHRSSSLVVVPALMILFILAFRLALRSPLNDLFYRLEASFIVVLASFFFLRACSMMMNHQRFTKWEMILCTLLIIPIVGALCANQEFGQPFLNGFIHQRDFYLIMSGFLLFYLLRFKRVSMKQVEYSFLGVSWLSLAVFVCCEWLINPAAYLETDFVGYNELKGGYVFRFTVTFIVFAFLYYFIRYFRERKLVYLLAACVFFSYLVFFRQDRTIIIATAGTALIFFGMHVFRRNMIKYSILGGMTVVVLGVFFACSNTTFFDKFDNVFRVLQGQETSEASTNVRRNEVALALPYIAKNPLLGNGELSNQWNGGYEKQMGYFFPSDIGVVGVVFVAGFLGLILLYVQFWYGFRIQRKVRHQRYDLFFLSCKYFLLYLFVDSLTAGQIIFYTANSVVVITILFVFYEHESRANFSGLLKPAYS